MAPARVSTPYTPCAEQNTVFTHRGKANNEADFYSEGIQSDPRRGQNPYSLRFYPIAEVARALTVQTFFGRDMWHNEDVRPSVRFISKSM